jgi:long-chain alkane monooxygenase
MEEKPRKKMLMSALHQMTVQHTSAGFWRHPNARSNEYKSLDFWIEYAQRLEAGGFDTLFFADIIGIPNIYRNGDNAFAVEYGMEVPAVDPSVAIAAIAQATSSIGLALTLSTTYEHPYLLARKLSSLDHFTGGRFGWNVVTSPFKSAAVELGLTEQMPHDQRYDRADEFMEVIYKLLEGSWEDDAVLIDRKSGRYSDPAKVHEIDHKGTYFSVPGIHVAEPSPQRTPLLFQAGSSSRGKQFAGKHAEGVFLASVKAQDAKAQIASIRAEAEAAGRNPNDVKILSFMTIVAAESDEAAEAKAADYYQYFDYEGQLALMSANFGIDLFDVDPDQTLEGFESDAVRGLLENYTKRDPNQRWTIRDIVMAHRLCGPGGALIIGGPETIADKLEEWQRISDCDGFMFSNTAPPLLVEDIIDYVVPVLRERGLVDPVPTEATTLRERIFGNGDRLPDTHPAAAFRH